MSIKVAITNPTPISAAVTNPSQISAVASGASGPQGPTGPQGPALIASVNGQTGTVVLTSVSVSAASAVHTHVIADVTGLQTSLDGKASLASTNVSRVVSLNGLTGTLTIAAGANVTVSTSASSITIAAGGGGGGGGDVASVNGATGTVVLTSASVSAASAVHTHVISDVTGLQSALDAKQASGSYAAASHTHATSDIVGFDAAAAAAAPVQSVSGRTGVITLTAADVGGLAAVATSGSYTSLSNIPTTFTPASHTHAASDVTSGTFDAARIPTLSYTALANVPTTFTPATHTHDASVISAGTIDAERLPGNVFTSVSLTASANNYALPNADIVRFEQTSTSNFDITGFATSAAGVARLLLNASTHTAATITLKHADTNSTAVSRLLVPWKNDCVLDPEGGSAVVVYDGNDSRWRVA